MELKTLSEIRELADKSWDKCDSCDENDEYFWKKGFIMGYLNAKRDHIDNEIKEKQERVAEMILSTIKKP